MRGFVRLIFALAACCTGIAVLFAVQQAAWRNQITAEAIRLEAAAMAEQRIARAAAWTQTVAALYDLVYAAAFLALGMAAVLAIFAAIGLYQRNRLRRLMPTPNGLYPLQVIGGQVINPNLMIYPSLADNTPAAIPPQIALAASASTDRIALTANLADMKMTAAGAKLLAGRYDAPPPPTQPAQLPPPAAPAPTTPTLLNSVNSVIAASQPRRWLVGQNDAGDLASFDLDAGVHAGILGSTGTGKTTTAGYILVAQALHHRAHVIILDPKGGADWRAFAPSAEWRDADATTIGDQIRAIEAEHQRRQSLIARAGLPSVHQLPDPPAPILAVIEEFGDLSRQLHRRDSRTAGLVDDMLDSLFMRARASDIHLLLIDQYPEHWSNQIIAGVKWRAVFKLGPNQGAKLEEYKAGQLPDRGAFLVSGRRYNAWSCSTAVPRWLSNHPHPAPAQPIIDAPYTVHSPVREPFADPFAERSPLVGPTPAANAPSTEDGWLEWTISNHLPTHPELLTLDAQGRGVGISVLARAMALVRYGDADQYELMKSTASAVAGRLRRTVRVDGAPLGVDRSVTG